jgi:ligand-binding SRPBCC domain-containing protein
VDAPRWFADEQVRGPFVHYHHEHLFNEIDGRTDMQDRLSLVAHSGVLERLILRRYVERVLEEATSL